MIRRLVLAGAVLVAAACASDGRTLAPPAPGATIPPDPPISVATTEPGAVIGTAGALVLTSSEFVEGGGLNDRFTCYGAGVSPPLQWSGVPAGTVELAVVVTDEDAGGLIHWVVTNLSAELVALGVGTTPEGSVEAVNDSGEPGWLAPCNDANGEPHHFVFTLYALQSPSGIVAGTAGKDAVAEVRLQSFAQAAVTATYPGA